MAYNRRFMLAADVFETILADSASEDEQSVESSSASDQSSAELSAGDEDVDNGQSSGRKRKVARCAEVNGGWADNTDFKLCWLRTLSQSIISVELLVRVDF